MATTGTRDGAPRRGLGRLLARVPRWLREVLLVGVIYGAYELSRGVRNGAVDAAFRNGRDILRWEHAVDLDPEKLFTHALVGVTPLAVAAAYFYSTAHYLVTPAVLVWMYRAHPAHYRFARTALAFSTMLGLIGFYLVPTAPPRLLDAGIPDALFDVRHWGWWGGDGSVPRGLGGLTNQFAAMPSLHVGWALWCGVLLYRHATHVWLRVLGVLYPLTTTVVVLSTGNHYLLDAVAGAVVMGLGALLALAARTLVRRGRRPGDGPPPSGDAVPPAPAEAARTEPGRAELRAPADERSEVQHAGACWS